jgi:hypothetical protein
MSAAPDALRGAHRDHPRHVLSRPGQRRRAEEDQGAGEEHAPQPQEVADPPAEDHQRGQRQDVGGEQPLPEIQRPAQSVHHLRRRQRHGGLIDQDHAVGERHGHERQPRAADLGPRADARHRATLTEVSPAPLVLQTQLIRTSIPARRAKPRAAANTRARLDPAAP